MFRRLTAALTAPLLLLLLAARAQARAAES